MNQMNVEHPNEEQLEAYSLGDLDLESSAEIESHIEDCHDCSETLLGLSSKSDTFLSLLRRADADRSETPAQSPWAEEKTKLLADDTDERPIAGMSPYPEGLDDLPPELSKHPRYRLVELLGRGGMGDVFQAEHKLMNRVVALKLINRKFVAHPHSVERFRREVQAAARLSHPNIVTAYDAEQAGEVHFLVMEYVEGTDLAAVVQERGPLSASDACTYIRQAAAGLQHAHELGMVHRDIKPHNLMVTPGGQVKILDFGLASFVSETAGKGADLGEEPAAAEGASTRLTSVGSTMGTPDYISPEQAQDAGSVDIRSDLYSLGCTLYFLLTGKQPFPDGTLADKVRAHAEDQPQPVTKMRDDVPVGLADVVDRMMSKKPADRFQTPAEVADALTAYCPESTIQPTRNTTWRMKIAGLSAAAVIVAAIAVYLQRDKNAGENQHDVPIAATPADSRGETPDGRPASRDDELVDEKVVAVFREDVETDRFRPRSLAFSPNNVWLASAGGDGDVKISSPGKKNSTEKLNSHGPRDVWSVAFSPDSHWLASATHQSGFRVASVPRSPYQQGTRLLASPKSGFQLPAQTMEIRCVAFAPDGKTLATGTNKNIYFWDPLQKGRHKYMFSSVKGSVVSIAYAPDGKTLALGSRDGRIVLATIKQDKSYTSGVSVLGRITFKAHENGVNSVVYSPDGKLLVSAGFDTVVKVWNANTGELQRTLKGHAKDVTAVALHPGGKLLASASIDGTVRLWDLQTGQLLQTIRVHTDQVHAVAFSPNGKMLATASWDKSIKLWDVTVDPAADKITEKTSERRNSKQKNEKRP